MENNANGVCPSNTVTGKYWERKNSFSVMGRDKTLKTECNGPDKLGKAKKLRCPKLHDLNSIYNF